MFDFSKGNPYIDSETKISINYFLFMDEDKNLFNVLKWIGIAALVAIPIYFISKHVLEEEQQVEDFDDENIFAEELQ